MSLQSNKDIDYSTIDSIIDDLLYISSYEGALNKDSLIENGISHILTLGSNMEPKFKEDFIYKVIPIQDEDYAVIYAKFDESFQFLDNAFKNGGRVLVHCEGGVSRSACVCIAFLMHHFPKMSYEVSSQQVRGVRPFVAPNLGFIEQLKLFESTGRNVNVLDDQVKEGLERIRLQFQDRERSSSRALRDDLFEKPLSPTMDPRDQEVVDMLNRMNDGFETGLGNSVSTTKELNEPRVLVNTTIETNSNQTEDKTLQKHQGTKIIEKLMVDNTGQQESNNVSQNTVKEEEKMHAEDIASNELNRLITHSTSPTIAITIVKKNNPCSDDSPNNVVEPINQISKPLSTSLVKTKSNPSICNTLQQENNKKADILRPDPVVTGTIKSPTMKYTNKTHVSTPPTRAYTVSDKPNDEIDLDGEGKAENPFDTMSNLINPTMEIELDSKTEMVHGLSQLEQIGSIWMSLPDSSTNWEGNQSKDTICQEDRLSVLYSIRDCFQFAISCFETHLEDSHFKWKPCSAEQITRWKKWKTKLESAIQSIAQAQDSKEQDEIYAQQAADNCSAQKDSNSLNDTMKRHSEKHLDVTTRSEQMENFKIISDLLLFHSLGPGDACYQLSDIALSRLAELLREGDKEDNVLEQMHLETVVELIDFAELNIVNTHSNGLNLCSPLIIRLRKRCEAKILTMVNRDTVIVINDILLRTPMCMYGSLRLLSEYCFKFHYAVLSHHIAFKGKAENESLFQIDLLLDEIKTRGKQKTDRSNELPRRLKSFSSAEGKELKERLGLVEFTEKRQTRKRTRKHKTRKNATIHNESRALSVHDRNRSDSRLKGRPMNVRRSMYRNMENSLPYLRKSNSPTKRGRSTYSTNTWNSRSSNPCINMQSDSLRKNAKRSTNGDGRDDSPRRLRHGRNSSIISVENDVVVDPVKALQGIFWVQVTSMERNLRLHKTGLYAYKIDNKLEEKIESLREYTKQLSSVHPFVMVADGDERPGLCHLPKASFVLHSEISNHRKGWGVNQTPYIFDCSSKVLVIFPPSNHDTALQRPDDIASKFRTILRTAFEVSPLGGKDALMRYTETATLSQHASAGFVLKTVLYYVDRIFGTTYASDHRLGDEMDGRDGTVTGGYLRVEKKNDKACFYFTEESGHYGIRWNTLAGSHESFAQFMELSNFESPEYKLIPYYSGKRESLDTVFRTVGLMQQKSSNDVENAAKPQNDMDDVQPYNSDSEWSFSD